MRLNLYKISSLSALLFLIIGPIYELIKSFFLGFILFAVSEKLAKVYFSFSDIAMGVIMIFLFIPVFFGFYKLGKDNNDNVLKYSSLLFVTLYFLICLVTILLSYSQVAKGEVANVVIKLALTSSSYFAFAIIFIPFCLIVGWSIRKLKNESIQKIGEITFYTPLIFLAAAVLFVIIDTLVVGGADAGELSFVLVFLLLLISLIILLINWYRLFKKLNR